MKPRALLSKIATTMDIKPEVEYDSKRTSGTIDFMLTTSIVPCPESKEDVSNLAQKDDAYTTNDNIPYNDTKTFQVTREKSTEKI